MPQNHMNRIEMNVFIQEIVQQFLLDLHIILQLLLSMSTNKRRRTLTSAKYSMINRMPYQVRHMNRLIGLSDTDCIANLRMDRNTFGRLCLLMRELGSLSDGKYVSIEEQVAMFLGILAHHKKSRIVGFDFLRSSQTVSAYLHVVLKAVLKLNVLLLVKPDPVSEECDDYRWKWFKGCLGALDGTYINVTVPTIDKPRFRSRKGQICTNTLAVCDRSMRFAYVLSGWEGSAADSRILRNAVNRQHGLKVPRGSYYLCDSGYANTEGFLAPYRGVRYHLKEWGPARERPQNRQEMFNMRHAKARNVIERAFGIMKMRWRILRSASYYPVRVNNRLIMACFLLHNFIRREMEVDPIETEFDEDIHDVEGEQSHVETEFIDAIDSTAEWNSTRDQIAESMWISR